jgi:hypothetical protein
MLRRSSGPSAVLVLTIVASLLPSPASAWGFAAHRAIMRRAIDILPPEIKPFFVEHRDEMVYRAVDPDMWRSAGWDDDHNHFVNFGSPELGPAPFTSMPRDYSAALQQFGPATLNRLGTLPWRQAEMFGNLQRAFERIGDGNVFLVETILVFAAASSHYIQDAHQPLHASNNYNGQLTDQLGLHVRFETQLFERFESRLTLTPAPPHAFASPRDYAFDALLASYQKMDALLKADTEALGSKDTYDDGYFEAFFTNVKPMLEERLSSAITATASVIVSAWEQAGRPSLAPKATPRAPQKVQRAR